MATTNGDSSDQAGDQAGRLLLDALVVVGSSAGGIEALSTLVASLPAGFPAPIILAQHLDPRYPSHLLRFSRGTPSSPCAASHSIRRSWSLALSMSCLPITMSRSPITQCNSFTLTVRVQSHLLTCC